jgi:malonyl-CoA/methylmalonyl-CoA synthetase
VTELFPSLTQADDRLALCLGEQQWTYSQLAGAARAHVEMLTESGVRAGECVALWIHPEPATVAAIVGNLAAGLTTVPLSPKLGVQEVAHIVKDASPSRVLTAPGHALPHDLPGCKVLEVPEPASPGTLCAVPLGPTPAFVLYTSGTTGLPKGALITFDNIAAGLDALAENWQWTYRDTVVHALPLIHVHGLILGLLGSLRIGGALHYVPQFSPAALAEAMTDPRHAQTLLFAVPTMIRRLAEEAERDEAIREALRRPRLLISGSAALPLREHSRIQALTGRGVYERYGLTETLINCGVPASGSAQPGYVGPPLPGVELKLVDDARETLEVFDDETMGEIAVRSAMVFAGYLNQPEATAAVLDEQGWFFTGDLGTRTAEGSIRIVGRRSTDLIKSGGYRVGAGEVEACLLEHPSVGEVAVVGVPDADLGQRITAFVVPVDAAAPPDPDVLKQFVASQLSPHKRPREVHFCEDLPRNAMGKVQKKKLLEGPFGSRKD